MHSSYYMARYLASAFVAGMLWNILGMDVLPHQPLMEAGLSEAGVAQLRIDVLDCYNVALPANILSQYTTKARLAAFISSCLDLPNPSTDINRGNSRARSQAVGRAPKTGWPEPLAADKNFKSILTQLLGIIEDIWGRLYFLMHR